MNQEELQLTTLDEEKAKKFLDAGVHFGQQQSKRSPKMDKFIYGISKNGIQIIDLDKTWQAIQETGEVLKKLAADNKNVLFVGTNKRAISKVLLEYAEKYDLHYIASRWLGGTLTNPVTRNRINYLRELEGMEQSGLMESLNAKEKSFVGKKLKKLRKNLGGLKQIRGAIHAIVLIDPMYEENATLEALKMKGQMKIMAVTDTDCKFDPNIFDHVIPCNASALGSLREVMDCLMGYIEAGKEEAAKKKAATPVRKAGSTIKKPAGAKPAPRKPAKSSIRPQKS